MKNIFKYLPNGIIFNKRYLNNFKWHKLLTSIETTVEKYDSQLDENIKIFENKFINSWRKFLGLPDNVFYFDINPYREMLIKLAPKSNTTSSIYTTLSRLGIYITIFQSANNHFACAISRKSTALDNKALEAVLPLELIGGSAIEGEKIKLQIERYLDKILPATATYIVEILD